MKRTHSASYLKKEVDPVVTALRAVSISRDYPMVLVLTHSSSNESDESLSAGLMT